MSREGIEDSICIFTPNEKNPAYEMVARYVQNYGLNEARKDFGRLAEEDMDIFEAMIDVELRYLEQGLGDGTPPEVGYANPNLKLVQVLGPISAKLLANF